MALEQCHPGCRGGRPDDRQRAVRPFVPTPGERIFGLARGLADNLNLNASAVHEGETSLVVLSDKREQR